MRVIATLFSLATEPMRKSQLKKNILIVRLSSAGDIVLASPLAEILKRHNPNSHIVWATQPDSKAFLEHNPYIDEIYLWDRKHWQQLWKKRRLITLVKECFRVHTELKQKNFQVAYDLQGLFKSGLLAWLSGAKERIGIGSREGSYVFMHKILSRNIANRDQMGSEYRYLVNQLGYSDGDWKIQLYANPEATTARRLAPALRPDEAYAVVCPFTTKSEKQWREDHWRELLLRIRGRYQLKTIILGNEEEREKGEALAKQCGAINLVGIASLAEASNIIHHAKLAVGVDNALTHLSQASNTPSVAIFGPSRPYMYTDNESSKVVHLDKPCSPCQRRPICKGGFYCMSEITPEKILTELKVLLRHSNQRI